MGEKKSSVLSPRFPCLVAVFVGVVLIFFGFVVFAVCLPCDGNQGSARFQTTQFIQQRWCFMTEKA